MLSHLQEEATTDHAELTSHQREMLLQDVIVGGKCDFIISVYWLEEKDDMLHELSLTFTSLRSICSVGLTVTVQ